MLLLGFVGLFAFAADDSSPSQTPPSHDRTLPSAPPMIGDPDQPMPEEIEELADDPEYQEFLSVTRETSSDARAIEESLRRGLAPSESEETAEADPVETRPGSTEPLPGSASSKGSSNIPPAKRCLALEEEKLDLLFFNHLHAETFGFKRRVPFLEIFPDDRLSPSASPWQLTTQLDFRPGELIETGRPLDVAIQGRGLFVLRSLEDGTKFYSRYGRLEPDETRRLVLRCDGGTYLLDPEIHLPQEAGTVSIEPDGTVTVVIVGSGDHSRHKKQRIGKIECVRFANPVRLAPQGSRLFTSTEPSGPPVLLSPGGERGENRLRQGFLESSNVSAAREQQAIARAVVGINRLKNILSNHPSRSNRIPR
jgi:flagellar basal-body rod protein FlgG